MSHTIDLNDVNVQLKSIKEEFGIHFQVLRKSIRIWLQTSATYDWTLAEQE
ncbi:MAG: hypothetical protein P8O07_00085 [Crocinitomicaceae bacterium]|nr:hypothetical protein [Crocinitomicaceae bacterium]